MARNKKRKIKEIEIQITLIPLSFKIKIIFK